MARLSRQLNIRVSWLVMWRQPAAMNTAKLWLWQLSGQLIATSNINQSAVYQAAVNVAYLAKWRNGCLLAMAENQVAVINNHHLAKLAAQHAGVWHLSANKPAMAASIRRNGSSGSMA